MKISAMKTVIISQNLFQGKSVLPTLPLVLFQHLYTPCSASLVCQVTGHSSLSSEPSWTLVVPFTCIYGNHDVKQQLSGKVQTTSQPRTNEQHPTTGKNESEQQQLKPRPKARKKTSSMELPAFCVMKKQQHLMNPLNMVPSSNQG